MGGTGGNQNDQTVQQSTVGYGGDECGVVLLGVVGGLPSTTIRS